MAATVTPDLRPERQADSIERLAELNFRAKRVTCADELHGIYHGEINDVLTEMGL